MNNTNENEKNFWIVYFVIVITFIVLTLLKSVDVI